MSYLTAGSEGSGGPAKTCDYRNTTTLMHQAFPQTAAPPISYLTPSKAIDIRTQAAGSLAATIKLDAINAPAQGTPYGTLIYAYTITPRLTRSYASIF